MQEAILKIPRQMLDIKLASFDLAKELILELKISKINKPNSQITVFLLFRKSV